MVSFWMIYDLLIRSISSETVYVYRLKESGINEFLNEQVISFARTFAS